MIIGGLFFENIGRWLLYGIPLVFTLLLIYSHVFLGLNPAWLWERKFTEEQRPTAFYTKFEGRQLYGVDSLGDGQPLVMVHGSPGD